MGYNLGVPSNPLANMAEHSSVSFHWDPVFEQLLQSNFGPFTHEKCESGPQQTRESEHSNIWASYSRARHDEGPITWVSLFPICEF